MSRATAVVEVDVMVDGKKWKTLPLQFQLTHFAPMVRTTGSLRAGTLLGPENLEVVREKQMSATDFLAHKLEDVTGMVARRDLKTGQSLGLLDFGPPAVIHRGELVTVVLTKGNVKVTAKAIATQDAPQGETLTLVNPTSGAKLRGIATAPGLVVVQGN
jgi:flagella basal body P-ring formation protein FlgA